MPYEPYVGEIMPVAFNQSFQIPKGWALCNGQQMSIVQNQALFSLLGTAYGGDGKTTFNLPDLRGRAAIGGATNGVSSGSATVTLNAMQIPPHNHLVMATTEDGSGRSAPPAGNFFATATGSTPELIFGLAGSGEVQLADSTNVAPSGGSQPHENMQPYLAINYLIALQGIYPSRG